MFREVTFTDVNRAAVDAQADLVMDEDTFRAFYERNARGVWAYLARVAGDRQTADDLLQETFYRFLRAAAEHDSEDHRFTASRPLWRAMPAAESSLVLRPLSPGTISRRSLI